MAVLERFELEASPLADLHAIADQLGIDGFRRLRKPELIDAILGKDDGAEGSTAPAEAEADGGAGADAEAEGEADGEGGGGSARRSPLGRVRRRASRGGAGRARRSESSTGEDAQPESGEDGEQVERARGSAAASDTVAEGVVEVLGNGSAFLRVAPPDASDEDVYISAAQVRRCELVSGDRVSGPVRKPRRSERYPSLVRVEEINGASADSVADGARYGDLPVAYPTERLVFGAGEKTLEAIEWLTPLGLGSRAVIVGEARAGKTETLRSLLAALHGREGLELTLVLAGVRPEEIAQWQEGVLAPAVALSFASSADSQGQTVERAVDVAKRIAARGGDAVVLIDSLDGMHPASARKVLAAARNLRDSGSLTVIATATRPLGGETTVIALDHTLTATGRQPILDLPGSGTIRPELLVGDDGARAIMQARAAALESSSQA